MFGPNPRSTFLYGRRLFSLKKMHPSGYSLAVIHPKRRPAQLQWTIPLRTEYHQIVIAFTQAEQQIAPEKKMFR